MSDSIFHHIFFSRSLDIIPSHIYPVFLWMSVCPSLSLSLLPLFFFISLLYSIPFTLSCFNAPFVSGSTFLSCSLASEKRLSLCLRSPVQTTSLLYLFDIFFLFVYYVDAEQWRMCACREQTKSTMHKRARPMSNGMLWAIYYMYAEKREKWNQSERHSHSHSHNLECCATC